MCSECEDTHREELKCDVCLANVYREMHRKVCPGCGIRKICNTGCARCRMCKVQENMGYPRPLLEPTPRPAQPRSSAVEPKAVPVKAPPPPVDLSVPKMAGSSSDRVVPPKKATLIPIGTLKKRPPPPMAPKSVVPKAKKMVSFKAGPPDTMNRADFVRRLCTKHVDFTKRMSTLSRHLFNRLIHAS